MSDDRRLSDHLFGEGSDEDRRAFERRLAEDPDLQARMTRLTETADTLSALPAAAWEAIETGAPPSGVPAWAGRPALRRPGLRWAAVAAAVVVFALGLGTGALLSSPGSATSAPGQKLALRPPAGAAPGAAGVAYLTGSGHLVLVIAHLPATTRGHYYEAWLMTSLQRLVPLVSFRVNANGSARIEVPLAAAPAAYRYVDISLQSVAERGSHSGDSVLRGSTS